MDNMTLGEKVTRKSLGMASLVILILLFYLDIIPESFNYYVYTLISIIVVLGIYTQATKIKKTELDFEKKEIRQFLSFPIFTRTHKFPFSDFSIVMSEINDGPGRLPITSVSLTGRHRTITLAQFGHSKIFCGTHNYDHIEAQAMRQQIAARLHYRDLGADNGNA